MMNMWKMKLASVLVAAFLVAVSVGPAPAAGDAVVDIEWLTANQGQPDVVVLDVRPFMLYERGHIPGAVQAFGPWQTMNHEFVGFMMPDVAETVRMIRGYGVNRASLVVVYDEGMTAQDTCKSARALWTLHALGHDRVAILDGGFAAWEQAEKPVSKQAAVPVEGDFSGELQKGKLATLADVKAKLGSSSGVVFVDDRGVEEHIGHEKRSNVSRFGHLPGARSLPADYMTNAGINFSPSFLRDTGELEQMAMGVGIPADKGTEIITYSNHGLQAAMGYFVLHDLLGYTNVKVFDGSVLEAAADPDVTMQTNAWGYAK